MSEQIEIKRALVSVYDKTGLDELVRGLAAAGVELVSTGGSASLIESLGLPVTKVEDLTGFPECLDGRVKTLHPRVHAGILADRRLPEHVAQLEELGVAPFDLVVVNLYPFTDTVMSGASVQECIEKIDIGGPSMVRAAAKNHASVAIVTDGARLREGARGCAGWRLHAGRARGARGEGVRPHGDVRRPRGVLDGQRAHRQLRGQRLPELGRRDLGQERGAAVRREPAPAGRALPLRLRAGRLGRRRAAARQGDVLQQLRRHRRRPARGVRPRRPADRRDHQAREPVRDRRRHRCRRGAPARPRVRPGVRVRRRDRDQRPGLRRDGRAGRRDLHRGDRGAGVRRRRGRGAPGQEEHPDPRRRAAVAGRRGDPADQRRAVDAAHRRVPGRGRRPGGLDPRDRGRCRRGDPRRSRLRVARGARGQVQRHPARVRRRLGRDRHGPGQPGRLLPARGRPGRGSGPRARSPRPTRSSRSPTAPRSCSTPGSGPSSSRAGRCGTTRPSRRAGRPESPCTSPAPDTLLTDRPRPRSERIQP